MSLSCELIVKGIMCPQFVKYVAITMTGWLLTMKVVLLIFVCDDCHKKGLDDDDAITVLRTVLQR